MLVICDINIFKQGHYIGYNQYLLDHSDKIRELSGEKDILFLYNEDAKHLLEVPEGVSAEYISFPQSWRVSATGRLKIWKLIRQKANVLQATHLYFMDFDEFQIPIGFFKTRFTISGIYFRPHHRIHISNDSISHRLKTEFKRYKKIIAEKILLRNASLRNIFILNDPEGAKTLNLYHQKELFNFLPDPVFDYDYSSATVSRNQEEFSFLLFGALTERKNIRNVIEAFGLASFQQKAVLHLVGKTQSDSYLQSLQKLAVETLAGQQHLKSIRFNCDFVSDAEMEQYHAHTHVSVLIYRNFFGSSGLIGRAAKHRQFVLAPSVGLLAALTEQYNLGKTVDPLNRDAIASSMELAEQQVKTHNYEGAEQFYREHHPEQFLRVLFSSYYQP